MFTTIDLKRMNSFRKLRLLAVLMLLLATGIPHKSWACACGCSVFDIGGTSGLPTENDHGGRVFYEWDHSTQNTNWSGTSSAPAANNSDKKVVTDWLRVGVQYMFNREWGVMATLPYANREFTTDNNPPGPFNRYRVTDLADMEIMGMYTGFSKDMSAGLIFGLKLPTGNYTAPGFRPRHGARHGQHGPHSRRFPPGHAHRGQCLAVLQPGASAHPGADPERIQPRSRNRWNV